MRAGRGGAALKHTRGDMEWLVTVPPILSLRRHLSPRPKAQAAPGLMGITHPRRRGGDASERGGTNALRLPHDQPTPRTLLPIGQRSRLAAGIAADAGALLPHPFTPYRAQPAGGSITLRPVACRLSTAGLLSVAGLRRGGVTATVPLLAVSQGSLLEKDEGGRKPGCEQCASSLSLHPSSFARRGVGKFL